MITHNSRVLPSESLPNRRARRAMAKIAKATKRPSKTPISIISIHEAGHADARFMTATLMGHDVADAVSHIEIHHTPSIEPSTTFGPFFSADLEKVARQFDDRYIKPDGTILTGYIPAVITAAKSVGVDIDPWGLAKIMQAVAGPAAEARARQMPFDKIFFDTPECSNDVGEAIRIAKLLNWTEDKLLDVIYKLAAYLSKRWSKHLDHWNALLLLAKSLPYEGSMDGKSCWTTYRQALVSPHSVVR